jgi:hypothetical protein
MPITFENVDKKELDAAVADSHGGGGPFIDISAVEEIIFQLGFRNPVRRFAIKIDEHSYRSGIGFLGAIAHSGKLQGFHGSLIIIFHHESPFVYMIKSIPGEYEKHENYCNIAGFNF